MVSFLLNRGAKDVVGMWELVCFLFLDGVLACQWNKRNRTARYYSDEILCFLFSVHMSICPCTLAWPWCGIQKVWHSCYYILLACYRFGHLSNSNGGLLFSINVTFVVNYMICSYRTKSSRKTGRLRASRNCIIIRNGKERVHIWFHVLGAQAWVGKETMYGNPGCVFFFNLYFVAEKGIAERARPGQKI